MHIGFPQRISLSTLRVFSAPAKGDLSAVRGRSAADHHGNSSWVRMELFAPSHCAQDVLSEVLRVYPLLKLKVFVDDIKLHVWYKNKIEVIIDR